VLHAGKVDVAWRLTAGASDLQPGKAAVDSLVDGRRAGMWMMRGDMAGLVIQIRTRRESDRKTDGRGAALFAHCGRGGAGPGLDRYDRRRPSAWL
jgi:hypothetical protein